MYHLTINQKTIAIPLSFTEAAAWQQALRGQFSQENIEITGPDGQPVVLCIFCEQPAPATNLLGDWEVCEVHAHSLTTPDPLCAECGEPLSAEDIEAVLKDATGKDPDWRPYLKYLEEKYGALYDLDAECSES